MVHLPPPLLALFAGLVEDACGIHYGAHDREVFAGKLIAHAGELGHDSLLDYYYKLRYDDPLGVERAQLIEALLVHETYFFRELAPLRQLADHVARIVASRGHARVWSAACSTGEEPLTLAMLLDERGVLDRVELLATDLSDQVVHQAQRNKYRKRALRDDHPADLAARYLTTGPDGVTADPRLLATIAFRTLNLLDAGAIRMLGAQDAIVCRNVLIYFRDEQIVRVVDHLAGALAPDGLLAVGVSESLLRFGTTLVCEERGRAFFYRRPK